MRRFAFLSLLLTFIFLPVSAISTVCESQLKVPGNSFFILRPKSKQLLIGVLASTVHGHKILAVGDYYSSKHELLLQQLHDKFKVGRILWEGEILLTNDRDQKAVGIPTRTLNTSGNWFALQPNEQHANDPLELEMFFKYNWPYDTADSTDHLLFSDEIAHLDPFFNELYYKNKAYGSIIARHRTTDFLMVLNNILHLIKGEMENSPIDEISVLKVLTQDTADQIIKYTASRYRFYGSASEEWPWNQDLFPQLSAIAGKYEKTNSDYRLLIRVLRRIFEEEGKPTEFVSF